MGNLEQKSIEKLETYQIELDDILNIMQSLEDNYFVLGENEEGVNYEIIRIYPIIRSIVRNIYNVISKQRKDLKEFIDVVSEERKG